MPVVPPASRTFSINNFVSALKALGHDARLMPAKSGPGGARAHGSVNATQMDGVRVRV